MEILPIRWFLLLWVGLATPATILTTVDNVDTTISAEGLVRLEEDEGDFEEDEESSEEEEEEEDYEVELPGKDMALEAMGRVGKICKQIQGIYLEPLYWSILTFSGKFIRHFGCRVCFNSLIVFAICDLPHQDVR